MTFIISSMCRKKDQRRSVNKYKQKSIKKMSISVSVVIKAVWNLERFLNICRYRGNVFVTINTYSEKVI